MHHAQRRSIMAMLNSIEQQIVAVKALVHSDFDHEEKQVVAQAAIRQQQDPYLSDLEEEELAKLLEAERLEKVGEMGSALQRFHDEAPE